MAGKRLPLPKAKAARALHPVEALAAASTGASEGLTSTEDIKNTAPVESAESMESAVLAETSESSELLEIAEALESTAAAASIESAKGEEGIESPTGRASVASRKVAKSSLLPQPTEALSTGGFETLQKPPDAPTVGHYRRSFMLDPETLALIDELRWHLRCDKSEVVRRAVELRAREAGLTGGSH